MTKTKTTPHPKRRKLFVHIGMHKTGTSSIQYTMHERMKALKGHDILYPVTGRHPVAFVQHDMLYRAVCARTVDSGLFEVQDAPEEANIFAQLHKEIETANCNSIVISAENLWTLTPKEVERFANHFPDFDIVPVMFIRRSSDLVESLYLTNSRIGVTDRDNESLGVEFWKPYVGIDIRVYAQRWAKVAHDGKIKIHCYDGAKVDSVNAFWEILGLPKSELPGITFKYNTTQSKFSEFIRLICNRYKIDVSNRDSLISQFEKLRFDNNKISLLPTGIRTQFEADYEKQALALLKADYVEAHRPDEWVTKSPAPPVHLDGMLTALFVIGNALALEPKLKK